MDALNALKTRKSTALLTEPAPGEEDLQQMFTAAVRAPDHGCIRPWRFIVFRGKMRHELGEILAEAHLKKNSDSTEEALEKVKSKTLRAPLVVAVIAKVNEQSKIPAIEQVISAGAAAQNIMIAAHALGFAGIWRTGAPSFDEHVRSRLGASGEDHIVGFLYLGSAKSAPPLPDVPLADHVVEWTSVSG